LRTNPPASLICGYAMTSYDASYPCERLYLVVSWDKGKRKKVVEPCGKPTMIVYLDTEHVTTGRVCKKNHFVGQVIELERHNLI